MRLTEADMERRAAADIQHYGFLVNRKKALRELHPPLSRVLADLEDSTSGLQIAAEAARKRKKAA